MSIERSDRLYDTWRTSAEKFDYFVLGILGALCAYIANGFEAEVIGANPKTLELVALAALFGSALCGFFRVESTILLTRLNHKYLRANEQRGLLTQQISSGSTFLNSATGQIYSLQHAQAEIAAIEQALPSINKQMESAGRRAEATYASRNRLVVLGFLLLVGSRVWTAYYHAV
ncbi:hypothetical protein [Pseudoxanthomonas sp. 10H]|uniref:hypothetical protein n=1 Tax=Pseudoxanthomonas sp. 10H TaxID=3242729 RepID=UPI003556EFB8